ADIAGRRVIASSNGADSTPVSAPPPAHIAALCAVNSPASIPESTGSVELRQETGDGSGRYLVAVEFDRAAIGSDLLFGRAAALAALLVGLVAMLGLTYLLVWLWISK